MATPSLRREPTFPMDPPEFDPPRKILKAKRTLVGRSSTTSHLSSSISNTSSLIKPSLSKRGSSSKSLSKKISGTASLTKRPSLTKKASITKEISDIATTAIALDSGSHIGKTGVITEDDIGADVDVTEVDTPSAFTETGEAVVTSLRKSVSGTGSLTKKLSRKESSRVGTASVLSPPMPPGGLVEIAFSFDTTGSMSAALNEVKGRIKDIVQKLQSDVPGIRIAIFAHGDYCDKDNYIIKWIDFGATLPELHEFVNNCGDTGGGDGPECYELVLRRATEVLSWTPGSKRSLVIIGDDIPHEPGYKYGDFKNDINWRDECTKLKDMGVKVYGVAVRAGPTEQKFYQEIAKRTDGLMITLDKFNLIFDLMMAICYREGGDELLKAYQDELQEKYGVTKLSKNLSGMFSGLGTSTGTGLFGKTTGTTTLFGTTGTGLFGTITAPSHFGTFGTGLFSSKAKTSKKTGLAVIKAGKTKRGKTTKKTVMGKATDKVSARSGRKQKEKEREIPREKKNDRKFKKTKPLSRLQWSNWKLAASPTNNKNTEWTKWINGYCAKQLFTRDAEDAAVYELAIQPPLRKKKYVVAFSVVDKLPSPGKWSKKIVSRKDVREKCKQAIQQKASVFVRRGKFKKRNKKFMEKVRKFLAKSNYAFGTTKKDARLFKVKGFTL